MNGFKPAENPLIQMEYVEDRKRCGQPKEITNVKENELIDNVTKD